MTQARLKELVHYDPETGDFTLRVCTHRRKPGARATAKGANGYLKLFLEGRDYSAHRLAWLYMYGEWPKHTVDHINRVRTDNRIANLRDVTIGQNLTNLRNASTDQGAPMHGAARCTQSSKWRAYIKVNKRQIHLGTFDTQAEAHAAYIAARDIRNANLPPFKSSSQPTAARGANSGGFRAFPQSVPVALVGGQEP